MLEHFGTPCRLPKDPPVVGQCPACSWDIYQGDDRTCPECDSTVHEDCLKKCQQCGHEGCGNCLQNTDDGSFCSEECYEEWNLKYGY